MIGRHLNAIAIVGLALGVAGLVLALVACVHEATTCVIGPLV